MSRIRSSPHPHLKPYLTPTTPQHQSSALLSTPQPLRTLNICSCISGYWAIVLHRFTKGPTICQTNSTFLEPPGRHSSQAELLWLQTPLPRTQNGESHQLVRMLLQDTKETGVLLYTMKRQVLLTLIKMDSRLRPKSEVSSPPVPPKCFC